MTLEAVEPQDDMAEKPIDELSDAEIDFEYNALIGLVLGRDAVEADLPLRDRLGEPAPGGMTVVPDASDTGYVVPREPTDEDKAAHAARVMASLQRSFNQIKPDRSE